VSRTAGFSTQTIGGLDMTDDEKLRIVFNIIKQFNQELKKDSIFRLFDDEYSEVVTKEEVDMMLGQLHRNEKIDTDIYGYLRTLVYTLI
jgi:hypothetical protein